MGEVPAAWGTSARQLSIKQSSTNGLCAGRALILGLVLGVFGAVVTAQEGAPANTAACWGESSAYGTSCVPAWCANTPCRQQVAWLHVQVAGEMASWATAASQDQMCPWKSRATTHLRQSALVLIIRAAWQCVQVRSCFCQMSMVGRVAATPTDTLPTLFMQLLPFPARCWPPRHFHCHRLHGHRLHRPQHLNQP